MNCHEDIFEAIHLFGIEALAKVYFPLTLTLSVEERGKF